MLGLFAAWLAPEHGPPCRRMGKRRAQFFLVAQPLASPRAAAGAGTSQLPHRSICRQRVRTAIAALSSTGLQSRMVSRSESRSARCPSDGPHCAPGEPTGTRGRPGRSRCGSSHCEKLKLDIRPSGPGPRSVGTMQVSVVAEVAPLAHSRKLAGSQFRGSWSRCAVVRMTLLPVTGCGSRAGPHSALWPAPHSPSHSHRPPARRT